MGALSKNQNFAESRRAPGFVAVAPPYVQPADADRFENFATNKVTAVSEQPVSTFSIDVDTASYAFVRRTLEAGRLPRPDMVRVEEMNQLF